MHLEAPFRFPIREFSDIERGIMALATSRNVTPGSVWLAEGADLLSQELLAEHRTQEVPLVAQAKTAADIVVLLRALWDHPLAEQRPRFLRVEAVLAIDPSMRLSLRVNVPTVEARPRWMDLDLDRDPHVRERQLQVWQAIGQTAHLELLAV